MLWAFIISALIITSFISFKFWEENNQKTTWLSRKLLAQDYKVENFFLKVFSLLKSFEKILKFLFFVKIPSYIKYLLRNLFKNLYRHFKKVKDYIRGRYSARNIKKTQSSYLQSISKIKEDLKKSKNSVF